MMTESKMIQLLKEQPFLADLGDEYIALIADCAELKDFDLGDPLLQQNQPAQCFYLLLEGHISLRAHMPTQGALPIETIKAPAVLGWSWLVKPYKWHFDARALSNTHAIQVHTPCIIGKIENDKAFGFEMYRRFTEIIVDRLHASRLQMMDVYAKPEQAPL